MAMVAAKLVPGVVVVAVGVGVGEGEWSSRWAVGRKEDRPGGWVFGGEATAFVCCWSEGRAQGVAVPGQVHLCLSECTHPGAGQVGGAI